MPATKRLRTEFTYTSYSKLVSELCEPYHQTTFSEGKYSREGNTPLLILRHDIDMDLEAALRMALLENSLGVKATYFFMVRCPLYNVFGGEGAEQVRQILDSGHHFGLHFDCALYPDISLAKIDDYVARESDLLESFFQRPIEAISFHRPGHLELNGVELKRWPNSYERIFLEDFEYFSDSRGNWARGNPLDSKAFSARKNLHVLVHPIWWTETSMTPYQCLTELVQRMGAWSEHYISVNCQVWNEARQSGHKP
jgi:hypothetical protein